MKNPKSDVKELLRIYRDLYSEMAAQNNHIDPQTGKEMMLVTTLRERIERLSQQMTKMEYPTSVGIACPSNMSLH